MARDAVLEDDDALDLAEGGEERVEVGICEHIAEVQHFERRLGRREASRTASLFGLFLLGLEGCCSGECGSRI